MKHKRAKLLASLALSALLTLPFAQVAAAEEIEGAVQDEMLYVLAESYDVANGAYGSYEDNPDLWDLADASGPFGHPDGHTEAQDALAIQYYVLNN